MKIKRFFAFILILILALSATAFAAETAQKIEAYLVKDLNFIVDGKSWSPKDTDGTPLTPIIYNNRTYVPVRSLLEDKGVTVGYMDTSRSVTLDYSTMEPSKLTAGYLKIDGVNGESTEKSTTQLTLQFNPDFNIGNIPHTQEYSYTLEDSTALFLDGQPIEESLDVLIRTGTQWSAESVSIEFNEALGTIISVNNISGTALVKDDNEPKFVGIDVYISGPPYKLNIVFKFEY